MGHLPAARGRALDWRGRSCLCCRLADLDVPRAGTESYGYGRHAAGCKVREPRSLPSGEEPDVHRDPGGGAEYWSCAGNMAAPARGMRDFRAARVTDADRRTISD